MYQLFVVSLNQSSEASLFPPTPSLATVSIEPLSLSRSLSQKHNKHVAKLYPPVTPGPLEYRLVGTQLPCI